MMMTDLQTREVGGLETRGGPAPLDTKEIWELPEEEQLGARQADVLIHSLKFRAGERIRLAKAHVKEMKADLKMAKKNLRAAKATLAAERETLGTFASADYDAATLAEVMREHFPERFTNDA